MVVGGGAQGFIFLPLVSLKTLLMRQCLLPGPAQVWGAFLDPSPRLFSDGFKFPHINTHRRSSSSNTDNLDAHSHTYDAGKVRTDTCTGRQEVGSMLCYTQNSVRQNLGKSIVTFDGRSLT